MIDRYMSKRMKEIWSLENKYNKFLEVEIASLKAMSKLGLVPSYDVELIEKNAKFNVQRINELEEITHHDVIAFTRTISESLGEEKKWFHYGLTSTDVVDSSNALLLKEANVIITRDLETLLITLKDKAINYKDTPCIGRTHGMHAEATSFGLKWLNYYDELKRNFKIYKDACKNIEVVKISGAIGNYVLVPVETEEIVAKELGLGYAEISTQVLSRDRFSSYIMSLSLIASTLEKIAYEVRNLSRTEIGEVEEYFSKGQKGSSAMPHKKNPIASENICGCSRVIRSYVGIALENNSLWHERDISHSSTERIILPDATSLIDYMLTRFNKVISNLVVFTDKMKKNIYFSRGLVFSSRVLSSLISKGLSRETAYDLVQSTTLKSQENKSMFVDEIKDSQISDYLTSDEINECFNIEYYLRNVDKIYERVLGEDYE